MRNFAGRSSPRGADATGSRFFRRELPIGNQPVYNAAQFADQNANLPARERGSAIMKRNVIRMFLAAAAAALLLAAQTKVAGQNAPSAQHKAQPPRSVRLYIFDCGVLHNADMGRFNLKKEDVKTTDMSMGCFLIAHPKGNLIWDTGAIPDDSWTPTGRMTTQHVKLPDGQARDADVDKTLRGQLAEIGYSPSDINYLALSHYHYDHTANANEFASATWLVRQVERDAMFGGKFSGSLQPSTFSALQKSKTIIIKEDEYDVFGDGSVIIKSAPGHTQGHQVLYVKLAKTGGVVLSGDLYHYPAEKTLDRVPTFEFSQEQTRASRMAVDAFLKKTGAQLWIQHDFEGNAKLKKSPQFYE
jgi:glyoxylase-like metal-dependent hydrolase (beta-lactamase superfamily II)